MKKKKFNITVKDIALTGVLIAVIEVCKAALSWAPNIELTSFWVIMFSLFFGKKIFFVIPAFILIEGAMYGFHLWWIMYLYIWPFLAIMTRIFRKMESAFSWAVFSGVFGLLFGFLCSLTYVPIGAWNGGFTNGVRMAFGWWIAGIPWDFVHGAGNFVLMLVLYHPITRVMKRAGRMFEETKSCN